MSHRHVGIGGIEKKMQEKYKKTDESITQAFKDLDALIEKVTPFVYSYAAVSVSFILFFPDLTKILYFTILFTGNE